MCKISTCHFVHLNYIVFFQSQSWGGLFCLFRILFWSQSKWESECENRSEKEKVTASRHAVREMRTGKFLVYWETQGWRQIGLLVCCNSGLCVSVCVGGKANSSSEQITCGGMSPDWLGKGLCEVTSGGWPRERWPTFLPGRCPLTHPHYTVQDKRGIWRAGWHRYIHVCVSFKGALLSGVCV